MNSVPPQLPTDDDDVPSFQSIVEEELGETEGWVPPPAAPVRVAGIPGDVLGKLLPHYDQWQFAGAGGMGVVYKAWHRELMRWAAVKVLAPDQMRDPRALARFQNEAAVLAQLRHPNIVPVHDFGIQNEMAWLVMDFLDGIPLQEWAAKCPRKPAEMARMMAKIARAVGVVHASGISHRDLKPGNIFILHEEPVLLDFGLAQNMAWQQDIRLTQTGELAGTVAYLAPEQVQTRLGEPSPATDVHACGVMLFEMLAGHLPRAGQASEIIARLHSDEHPPRLGAAVAGVRSELEAICWCCMQIQPESRYPNGISLAEDLERFLDGRPVRAKNPDFLDRAYLFARRNPFPLAAGLVALIALAMFGWSATRLRDSQEKGRLLSLINRQLSADDWSPEKLAQTRSWLGALRRLDPVLGKYLEEDVQTRTASTVTDHLEAPRLTSDETEDAGRLIHYLESHKHPAAAELRERWMGLETAWKTSQTIHAPLQESAVAALLRPGGWTVKNGRLHADVTGSKRTWTTVNSLGRLNGAVEVEAVFGPGWQSAKSCGMVFSSPLKKVLRFYVSKGDRFESRNPDFPSPEGVPTLTIMQDMTPLAYRPLTSLERDSPRLAIRCRYENGDLSMTVNEGQPLHYTRIFEISRPLVDTKLSFLLPVESSLEKIEIRERKTTAPASPLIKADDLVTIGRAKEAMDIYERFLNRDDVHSECAYKYATCLEALQRPREAIGLWEEVAGAAELPWKNLALYQLWRCHLHLGEMDTANSWFDLLMAGNPPEMVSATIPASDRLMLNQHYLPLTRSVNCMKVTPADLPDLDRAVRVQQFLGADDRQLAIRTSMAFHFAGMDARARQMLSQAVAQKRPSPSHTPEEIFTTMVCLDHWGALGQGEGDALLQATVTAWHHALKGSQIPARAVPLLEDMRHELRRYGRFKGSHRETVRSLTEDPAVMLRHRIEALLLAGLAESLPEPRLAAWQRAAAIIGEAEGRPDMTQQRLQSEFIARCASRAWTPKSAGEWMGALLGKARPLVSQDQWLSPLLLNLMGQRLAEAFNRICDTEEGEAMVRQYILRSHPARDTAGLAMKNILSSLLAPGLRWPANHPELQQTCAQMVAAYHDRQLTEIMLMQYFQLWSGFKNTASWESLTAGMQADLRRALSTLLVRRYEALGRAQEAADFSPPGIPVPATLVRPAEARRQDGRKP